jgi:hypothetical protein
VVFLATPFSNIFTKFLSLVTDRDLVTTLTDEELTDLLYVFLDQSVSVYFKKCTVDLTDYEEPDYYSQSYTASGASADFVLSQYPTSPDADAISYTVTVDGVATTNYTFTAATQTFTLTSMPTVGQTVICSYEFSGQFNNSITSQMEWILAWGLLYSWYQQKVFNVSLFKNRLNTKDFQAFSSANLLDKLIMLRNEAERTLRNMVISISFDSGHNFDEE